MKKNVRKNHRLNLNNFVLNLPRDILYGRINKRVDIMREEGLENEVKELIAKGCTRNMVSMQGLGYKEIIDALEKDLPLDDAFEKIKQETRHFAKRQITWFKREKEVEWLDKDKFNSEKELLNYCVSECQKII